MIDQRSSDNRTMPENAAPTVLAGRYRIVRQLGQGGMGSVWLAEDTKLDGRKVSVKMLPSILVSNKRAYRQVKDEALVSLKLSHPNIVSVRSFEEDNSNPFLVMDYIDGQTLDDYLADKGKLSEDETVKLLKPIANALDYAHSQGVVHRDVKPGNVMIAADGHPYILDFGIAREVQETMTRVTGKLSSGTLMYMSPEQLNGAAPKPAQDIYSFAAMVYECLNGEPPFLRGQIEFQILNNKPVPLGVQFKCDQGVMMGLEKLPEARPVTCSAILDGACAFEKGSAFANLDQKGEIGNDILNVGIAKWKLYIIWFLLGASGLDALFFLLQYFTCGQDFRELQISSGIAGVALLCLFKQQILSAVVNRRRFYWVISVFIASYCAATGLSLSDRSLRLYDFIISLLPFGFVIVGLSITLKDTMPKTNAMPGSIARLICKILVVFAVICAVGSILIWFTLRFPYYELKLERFHVFDVKVQWQPLFHICFFAYLASYLFSFLAMIVMLLTRFSHKKFDKHSFVVTSGLWVTLNVLFACSFKNLALRFGIAEGWPMSVKLALKCAAKDDGGIVFLAMDRLSSQGHVIAAEAYLRAFPHQSNARDQKTGVTPLMVGVHSWCCWHSEGSSGLFRFLIDYGADVNAVDIDGNTALHYVAAIASDRREPCAFLLSAGIDPTIKNNEGIDAATLSGGWSGGEKVFREVIRNWSVKRKN